MKKQYIIPIFVPHLGCPNDCTFCNQRKISGQLKNVTENDVRDTIEFYLSNFKEKNAYKKLLFMVEVLLVLMLIYKKSYWLLFMSI